MERPLKLLLMMLTQPQPKPKSTIIIFIKDNQGFHQEWEENTHKTIDKGLSGSEGILKIGDIKVSDLFMI